MARASVAALFCLTLAACTPQRQTNDAAARSVLVPDEVTGQLGVSGATNAGAGVTAVDDRVVVTWAATTGDRTDVFAATSVDDGRTFLAPVRVNDIAGDARMSGEQAPRASFSRKAPASFRHDLIVGWISRLGGQSSIRVARSTDSGRTFAPARTVHASKLAGMRGWPSFALSDGDVVHTAWLDTREAASKPAVHAASPEGHGGHHGSTRQDLYHAFAAPGGTWAETTIATDVCFCCKTAVATGLDGTVYVAFRNVYPTNFCDTAVARSTDGGKTFTPRVSVDQAPEGIHAGHLQVAASGTRVFATWDETTGAGYRVQLREVGSNATSSEVLTVSDAPSALYPAIAATDHTVVTAWTERSAERSRIVVRRIATR